MSVPVASAVRYFRLWCKQQNITPQFDLRTVGPIQNPRYLCEIRVPSFLYVGNGHSTVGLEAKMNAVNDFVQFLLREGNINLSVLQNLSAGGKDDNLDEASLQEKQLVIDEYWKENAELILNQFLNNNKLAASFEFSVQCEVDKSTWSFACISKVSVDSFYQTVIAKGTGPTKDSAQTSSICLLVQQLLNLGLIEKSKSINHKGKDYGSQIPLKSKKSQAGFEVIVNPALIQEANDILQELDIELITLKDEVPNSIVNHTPITSSEADIIDWSLPVADRNVWKMCKTEERPMEDVFLERISFDLEKDMKNRLKTDTILQEFVKNREKLPIHEKKAEILEAITTHPIAVIIGNPQRQGTTQICQYILDDYILAGLGSYCNILVTTPNRLSAMSAADRISIERREELGTSVGYSVQFEDLLPRLYGSILFCSADVFLQKLEYGLKDVSHIIVDGIQERDANTDLILFVLQSMVQQYSDLRIVLISDHLQISVLNKYFSDCPSIEIPRKMPKFEVTFLNEIIYMVNQKAVAKRPDLKYDDSAPRMHLNSSTQALIEAILVHIKDSKMKRTVLIYEKNDDAVLSRLRFLRQHPIFGKPDYSICPLHAHSSIEDLKNVSNEVSSNVTKIILSTSVAESCLIIDDVLFVIDTCKIQIETFIAESNLTMPTISCVSQACVESRQENTGKVKNYFCLISKEYYLKQPKSTTSDILQNSLLKLLLTAKLLQLGPADKILNALIEPPLEETITKTKIILQEMRCFDMNDELTPLGQMLARLAIEPRLGKMMILSIVFGIGDAVAALIANYIMFPLVFASDDSLSRPPPVGKYRFSYHINMLSILQKWSEKIECELEEEEVLNSDVEVFVRDAKKAQGAKDKFKDLLMDVGFAKESLLERKYNFEKEDDDVNMMTALLAVGLSPNICQFKRKQRVHTENSKNCYASSPWFCSKSRKKSNPEDMDFYSPFFVCGEKVSKNGHIEKCKQLNMVTPIQLLLFGCRKIEWVKERRIVKMDSWIELQMDPAVAYVIFSLRLALDKLVMKVAKNPKCISSMSSIDQKLIEITRKFCAINSGCYKLENTIDVDNGLPAPDMNSINTPPVKLKRDFKPQLKNVSDSSASKIRKLEKPVVNRLKSSSKTRNDTKKYCSKKRTTNGESTNLTSDASVLMEWKVGQTSVNFNS